MMLDRISDAIARLGLENRFDPYDLKFHEIGAVLRLDLTPQTVLSDIFEDVCHDWPLLESAKHLYFLPQQKTWIELSVSDGTKGTRVGYFCHSFMTGMERTIRVCPFLNVGREYLETYLSIGGSDHFAFIVSSLAPVKFESKENAPREDHMGMIKVSDGTITSHMKRVLTALFLINSPAVTTQTIVSHPKLNAARLRRNKRPLFSYADVDIRYGREGKGGAGNGERCGVAYHSVRSHVRMVNGVARLVRAHWRGDPSKGVRFKRYQVTAVAPP